VFSVNWFGALLAVVVWVSPNARILWPADHLHVSE
jgi:hypothetical protein